MAVGVRSAGVTELVARDAELTQVATGFQFTEGPVWQPREGVLYFSDIPSDVIHRLEPSPSGPGSVSEFRRPSQKSNGLTLDRELRLIACQHSSSEVTRTGSDGVPAPIATHWEGTQLNSPNDVVVRSDGSIFFTDPIYGRRARTGIERPQDLDFQGVYRIDPGGELHLLLGDMSAPNGLAFSVDESTLYVDDSQDLLIRRFGAAPDGSLSGGEVIYRQEEGSERGVPDGMKVDERGNIWVTGPGGVWVLGPDGSPLGVIEVPERTANLTWGGPDRHDLYITASTSVYRVRTLVGPAPLPHWGA